MKGVVWGWGVRGISGVWGGVGLCGEGLDFFEEGVLGDWGCEEDY